MSKFSLEDDVLSIAHHPTKSEFAVSLVTGHVFAYSYLRTDPSERTLLWSTKRHKKACRSIAYSLDGSSLVSVGSDCVIKRADSTSGKVLQKWVDAHEDTINVVKWVNEFIFCTGDDSGTIKAWDTRKTDGGAVRVYNLHEDYISDLLPLDEKFILATSGDGTLSVHDLRTAVPSTSEKEKTGKKTGLIKQSDDQEDDLTSCLLVKQGSKKPKIVVGTSSGVGLIFNKGDYGDCNDRILPPKSGAKRIKRGKGQVDDEIGVECLAQVDDNSILVGGTDGKVRVLQVLPNQYLRVLGDFSTGEPVEAIVVANQTWVFAVSGTDVCIWSLHEPEPENKKVNDKVDGSTSIKDKPEKDSDDDESDDSDANSDDEAASEDGNEEEGSDGDQFSDSDSDKPKRKKPKQVKPIMEGKKNTFFDDL